MRPTSHAHTRASFRRLSITNLVIFFFVAGCGGQSGDAETQANCAQPAPGATQENTVAQEYAAELNVDLAEMTRTASGLCIQDLQAGTGAVAAAGDNVAVHYTGWLPNGQKFDSSRDRGEPIRLRIGMGEVIAGWDEGIVGLAPGARRRLVIPPGLGYGETGDQSGVIPPNSTLVFDVELVEVNK